MGGANAHRAASAIGPLLLAECLTRAGSYAVIFYLLAVIVSVLGIAAWFAPIPPRQASPIPALQ